MNEATSRLSAKGKMQCLPITRIAISSSGIPLATATLTEREEDNDEFGLVLCSHYLFLYSPHLSLDFHLRSIRELCRVAREVRIFPLLELGAVPSRHLEEVQKKLWEQEYTVSIVPVDYEFQRGGSRMMKVRNDAAV